LPTYKDFVGNQTFVDTETSTNIEAINSNYDFGMINIACCTVNFEFLMERYQVKSKKQWFYNTDLELNEEVTGITKNFLSKYNHFKKKDANLLNNFFKDKSLWAHNAAFDMKVIDKAFAKVNVRRSFNIKCTMPLAA
jgi:DNA polymerase III alpha subunit (gram-positive type)